MMTSWMTWRNGLAERLLGAAAALAAALLLPAQATQAQAAAEPRRYAVYFAHEKFEITTEAKALLRQASAYQQASSGRVVVTAHADRLGSRAYNLRLSRRRAREVGTVLASLGVPAQAITLRWTGETTLPHPTDDEMREPLNRCAVVLISPENS